jgi:hypothetical protein
VGLQQTAATETPQPPAAPAEAIHRTTTPAAALDRLVGHQCILWGISQSGTTLQQQQQQQLRDVQVLLQHGKT